MSTLSRSALRLLSCTKNFAGRTKYDMQSPFLTRTITRSLVVLASPSKKLNSYKKITPATPCGCGCGIHGMHTRGDRELVEFLQEEIIAEKQNQLGDGLSVAQLDDFQIKTNGAELTLTRKFNDELITVTVNVNHSVDTESVSDSNEAQEVQLDLKSRPNMEVDIKVGSRTLSFTLTFTSAEEVADVQQPDDIYGISELVIYEGEYNDEVYCASGDILDGHLYDLFMNMLQERGITNEFAEKLSTMCTSFEHAQYIKLLENIQRFVKRK